MADESVTRVTVPEWKAPDSVSMFEKFLREMPIPAFVPGPLFEALERDLRESKRKDDEWLASLTDHQRQVELTRRRIARLETRFAEALSFRRCDECGGCW